MSSSISSAFEKLPVFQEGRTIPGASPEGVFGAHGIRAFRHRASGVRVVIFGVPGPLVSATIVVGTEPISNAGHPHTLEHIVFLGSHKHPYRGYLDNLACRSISDGTNAWTDNEFTAYTATTAGLEGFVNLLPCFLDHILRPNISRAAFDSEVYHIRHDGKEAGVVFCEMQARENTEGDLRDTALSSILFDGTPLAFNSGGLCHDIRTLTNNDIVRFHHEQYCGANVSIVVGGCNIASSELLSSVQPLLDDISSAPDFISGLPRWRNSVPMRPLPSITRKILPFPSNDESIGSITIAWRGPGTTHRQHWIAIDVVMRYLALDVWSPLRQRFVEVEDQLASAIYTSQETFYSTGSYMFSFQGVNHLADSLDESSDDDASAVDDDENATATKEHNLHGETIADMTEADDAHVELRDGFEKKDKDSFLLSSKLELLVIEYLKSLCHSGELPGGISAIHMAIKKQREAMLSELESDSHSTVPFLLVEELVYDGHEGLAIGEELRGFFEQCDVLSQKDEQFWLSLIEQSFVRAPRVELVMVPDEELAERLVEVERKVVDERVGEIGQKVLSRLGKENEERIASLKVKEFTAESFPPIPNTLNISRFPYTVSHQRRPYFMAQSVALETDFVHCTLFLDSETLTAEQRMWLPLLCSLLSTCDILLDDGNRVKYTDNTRAISEATMGDRYGTQLGLGSMAHQCVVVRFTALPEAFEEAAGLVVRTWWQSEVTAARVAAVSQSMLAGCTADLRDAEAVLAAALVLVPFMEVGWNADLPNFVLGSFTSLLPTLALLSDELRNKTGKKVVMERVLQGICGSLEALRGLSSSDIMVEVGARNPEKALDGLERLWAERTSLKGSIGQGKVNKITRSDSAVKGLELPVSRRLCGRLGDVLKGRGTLGKVIGIGGVDSSFLEVRVDTEVCMGHEDWGALSVLLEMLCRCEGPLSDAVRVSGLAYGAHMCVSEWRGQLELLIYESSSLTAAWESVCRTLETLRQKLGATDVDGKDIGVDLDTAKASMLFGMTEDRSSPSSIVRVVRGQSAMGLAVSARADEALEEEMMRVTVRDLIRVFDRHVAKVYARREGCERLVVVTCGALKVKETIDAFAESEWALKLEECTTDDLVPKQVRALVKRLKS